MSALRWFLPMACALAAACSCMSTATDAGDAPDERFEDGDGGEAAEETWDDLETAVSDGPEHREVGREEEVADVMLPEAATLPPACGDGVVDPGEECDDGNRLNGDGCDFMCRRGSDPFDYPPPDPGARPVEPSGPPVEVSDETEMSVGVWLNAGGGRFALVYNYAQPYLGVRMRILDRAGRTVGEPWAHETSWFGFGHVLFPIDGGFGLLSGSYLYGLMRSRFALDGTPLEEFLLLRPARRIADPWDELASGAYCQGRWLAVSFLLGSSRRDWLLESFTDDGTPARVGAIGLEGGWYEYVSAVPTGSGFAVGDGNHVVVLDGDLNVVSWSGSLSYSMYADILGPLALSSDGFWVAWSQGRGDVDPDNMSIWVAALDLDGTPRFPPRRILEGLPEAMHMPPTDAPEMVVADGPAGAAVVYWQGIGDGETEGGPVMLVTVDDWGNVITPPTPVLGEGEITTFGMALAIAADDLGYGVVTMVPGSVLGTTRLVFRYFTAAP